MITFFFFCTEKHLTRGGVALAGDQQEPQDLGRLVTMVFCSPRLEKPQQGGPRAQSLGFVLPWL